MKSVAYITGFVVGIAFVALFFIIAKKLDEKKHGKAEKASYDERQVAVRGKAFAFGFWLYTGFEGLAISLFACEVNLPISNLMLHGIIFFASLLGFVIYCIWTDAYFQNGERKGTWAKIIILALIVNIAAFILPKLRGGNFSYVNLVITIFLAVILINVQIKVFIDKKSEKEEIEE